MEAVWAEEQGHKAAGRQVPGSWYDAAKKFRWAERAEAWDDEQRPAWQAQRLAALQALQVQDLRLAEMQIAKAVAAMELIEPQQLTPDQTMRMLAAGVDLRRRALEEPAAVELQRQLDELKARGGLG